MEIGRVIGGHYLLQRLIKQGPYAVVYQGIDQLFQRLVAVKAVPAVHASIYRAAVRKTSQFSYPNIICLYDLVIENEQLYLVQEYAEGDDFAALLQASLQPQAVADYGQQICSALLYASSSTRRICHGDLTPSAIIRDRRGLIRINNFALPSDLAYFTAWSHVGGEGAPLSDQELPWGVVSPGRHADDTRAVGLLLYQLLAGRSPSATSVEPPADGRLRFQRNTPAELCDVIARTIIRNHPQAINTLEVLDEELQILAESLELVAPVASAVVPSVAYQQSPVESPRPGQFSPAGKMSGSLPGGQPGAGLSPYRAANSGNLAPAMEPVAPSAPTVADASLLPATARQQMDYPQVEAKSHAGRNSVLLLLLIGLIIFALCFAIGFYGSGLFGLHP